MDVLDFPALWDLLESRFTRHLHNRHITAIQKLCEQRRDGVYLDELASFHQILTVCQTHIQNGNSAFVQCAMSVIECTLRPHLKSKSFEKVEQFETVRQYLQAVAWYLSLRYLQLTIAICRGLQHYLVDVLDYKVVHESGIVSQLVDTLRSWCYGAVFEAAGQRTQVQPTMNTNTNAELSLEIMAAIKHVSRCETCALSLVQKSDILDLKMLFDADMSDDFLVQSIELLLNCVETVPATSMARYVEIDHFYLLARLLRTYLQLIAAGTKTAHRHKSFVNDVFAVMLRLAQHDSLHKLCERSRLVHVLLQYANHALTQVAIPTNIDAQTLHFVFSIVHEISACHRVLAVLIDEHWLEQVLRCLFAVDDDEDGPPKWSDSQLRNLRTHFVFVLQKLSQMIPKYFYRQRVVNHLCSFLVSYQQDMTQRSKNIQQHLDGVSISVLRLVANCLHALTCTHDQKHGDDAKYNFSLSNTDVSESLQLLLATPSLCEVLLQIVTQISFEQTVRIDAVLVIVYSCHSRLELPSNAFRHQHAAAIIATLCALLHGLPSLPFYTPMQHCLLVALRHVIDASPLNVRILREQHPMPMLFGLMEKSAPTVVVHAIQLLLALLSHQEQSMARIGDEQLHILLAAWLKYENDDRVKSSLYVLYRKLPPLIESENDSGDSVDRLQQHQIVKILNHSKLMEGQQWLQLKHDLTADGVELTDADAKELALKIEQYEKLKTQLVLAENSLKTVVANKVQQNLQELTEKLKLYKAQKHAQIHNKTNKKGNILTASIKMNKDEKDQMLSTSLQINETMKKVLGDI